jgi:hypothetical protein
MRELSILFDMDISDSASRHEIELAEAFADHQFYQRVEPKSEQLSAAAEKARARLDRALRVWVARTPIYTNRNRVN